MRVRWSRQLTGAAVTAVLVAPFDFAGPVLLTGHADGRLRTWALLDGREVDAALDLKGGAVRCLACLERVLVCADDDGTLTHLTQRRISAQRRLCDSAVQALCVHRDATGAWQVVCATRDGAVRCERGGLAAWTVRDTAVTTALLSFAVLDGRFLLTSDGVSPFVRLLRCGSATRACVCVHMCVCLLTRRVRSASGAAVCTVVLPEPVSSGWAVVGGHAYGGTRSGALVRLDGTTLK